MQKELSTRLSDFRSRVDTLKGERNALAQIIIENTAKMQNAEEDIARNDKSILLLQLVIENRQNNIIGLFEKTVTSALKKVFGGGIALKIESDKRNNSSTADFMIHTDDYEGFITIRMCQGTSLKEIVGVFLRIVYVHLLEGRKILVLDECFTGVEYELQPLVGEFMKLVCDKFGIQIIMVTHCEPIYRCADKLIGIE